MISDNELKSLLLIGSDIEFNDFVIRNYKLGEIFKDLRLDKYNKLLNFIVLEVKDIIKNSKINIDELKIYDIIYDVPEFSDSFIEVLDTFTYLKWERGVFRDFISYGELKNFRFTENMFDEFIRIIKKMYCVNRGDISPITEINPDLAVDEETRKFAEEMLEFNKQNNKKKHKGKITLMGIINGICSISKNYNLLNVWELTVYQLMMQYYGIEQSKNYEYIMESIYHGVYDIKKNKLNIEDIHWACEIEIQKIN